MIRLHGRAAVYGELWYDEEPPADCRVDIVVHRRRSAPIAGVRSTPRLSLVTDLSVSKDAIANEFSKKCRYEIRRADLKDTLCEEFITDPESRLNEFGLFFDAFARQKSQLPCDHHWLMAACKAGQLALSVASRDGEALVWHAYVLSAHAVGLQYSGSCFRNRESEYRALIGRANRWLHWMDMLRLKQTGMERYDWGGLFEDESAPERAGINKFKRNFGGRQIHAYDCEVPVSMRGRLYLPLREAWRRRKPVGRPRENFLQRQPSG
jgi:phage terminase large subunit-like protein